jgi:Divergent InlB B-repeat domain
MTKTFWWGLNPGRWALAAVAVLLAACGGGGGSDDPAPPGPGTFAVTVSVSGNGKITSPSAIDCGTACSANVSANGTITLTATPAAGNVLQSWGGACATTTGNTCTLTVTQATSASATFVAQTFALSVAVTGNGGVASQPAGIACGSTCSANFTAATSVVLTATPAAGQVLQSWGGACASASSSTCTVTMNQASSVTATFAAAPPSTFALAVAVTGSGSVSSQPAGIACGSTCSANFAAASSVVLTATPAAGQVLQTWGGACAGSTATCTLTMSAARNVTATFVANSGPALAWGTAALLENSNDFNVAGTNLFADAEVLSAIDANGNALVVWQQSDGTPDGGTEKVFSRRYVAGQGWSAAVAVPGLVTSSSSVNFITGRLVMDAAGTATWIRHDFETRRYSAAAGWSATAFTPANSAGGSLSDVQLGADGAVHMLGIGASDVLYSRLAAASSQWSAWADASVTTLATRQARLALGAQGSVLAIWHERNPGDSNYSMKANRSVGGTWQTPLRIEEMLTNVQEASPRIASDAAGNAIAAWHQGSSVYVSRFSAANGTWGTPTEADAGQIGTTFSARIQLAMAADGRAVVAWNSTFALKAMSAAPGAAFSAPVVVNTYNAGYFLGIDSGGRAVVVYRSVSQWPNPTDATINVYARELPAGGAWSAAALLETGAGEVKANVPCAMNTAGQTVCAWAQDDLPNDTIRNSLWATLRR